MANRCRMPSPRSSSCSKTLPRPPDDTMPVSPHRQALIPGRIVRPLFNTLVSTVGFAAVVIVPAGMCDGGTWGWRAWSWGRGWVMVGVFLLVHVIGTLRIVRANPDLLRERARLG